MNKNLKLFGIFFKIGLFTFGGGLAMLPLIEEQVVKKNNWITEDEMGDVIAISEATPGPIAINSATFIGYRVGGFFGALFATLGVILPPLIIITLISFFVEEFLALTWVNYAFMGIRAAVAVLILKSVYNLFKKTKKYWFSYMLMVAAVIVSLCFPKLSTIYILLGGAVIGIIIQIILAKIEDKKKKPDEENQTEENTTDVSSVEGGTENAN